jgi:hypothetical protein
VKSRQATNLTAKAFGGVIPKIDIPTRFSGPQLPYVAPTDVHRKRVRPEIQLKPYMREPQITGQSQPSNIA